MRIVVVDEILSLPRAKRPEVWKKEGHRPQIDMSAPPPPVRSGPPDEPVPAKLASSELPEDDEDGDDPTPDPLRLHVLG